MTGSACFEAGEARAPHLRRSPIVAEDGRINGVTTSPTERRVGSGNSKWGGGAEPQANAARHRKSPRPSGREERSGPLPPVEGDLQTEKRRGGGGSEATRARRSRGGRAGGEADGVGCFAGRIPPGLSLFAHVYSHMLTGSAGSCVAHVFTFAFTCSRGRAAAVRPFFPEPKIVFEGPMMTQRRERFLIVVRCFLDAKQKKRFCRVQAGVSFWIGGPLFRFLLRTWRLLRFFHR